MGLEMVRAGGRTNARERILEAAVTVAHEVGPAHLSLDAVAERAGVSKGGLLYHFPSKQALITALVERHLAAVETAVGLSEDGAATDGKAVALGILRSFCSIPAAKPGGAGGFLAALAETPSLLDPIREHNGRIVACLRRAPEPEIALIAFLVVEGMRSLSLFDSNPLSVAEAERILARLQAVLERSGPADAAPG